LPDREVNDFVIASYRASYDGCLNIGFTGFYQIDGFGVSEGDLPDFAG
jgi:hypothetical protein